MSDNHPATFTEDILAVIDEMLGNAARVLDPFAGVGGIHALDRSNGGKRLTQGVEIEHEWADAHRLTLRGSAHELPFANSVFDAIATSPCLAHGERVLTADLRWVDVATIQIGDQLIAFDESHPGAKANGAAHRRKFRFATVTHSEMKEAPLWEVVLETGEHITTTGEHPWLAHRSRGYSTQEWIQTKDLREQSSYVLRQFPIWEEAVSRDAGWLAGIMDGEGSLSLGAHGAPKLVVSQAVGLVSEEIERVVKTMGYGYSVIPRRELPHCRPMLNHYITNGVWGIVLALGELRPLRLLEKWSTFDLSTRTIQPTRVKVSSVVLTGNRGPIQEIETSTGTYIGEGYLMHNCYGNRMADTYDGRDGSKRATYRIALGHDLNADNSGGLQWGAEYRDFHRSAWAEAVRVLKPGGRFILNIKDHIRKGERQRVADWHVYALAEAGLFLIERRRVPSPGMRFGANADLRIDYEEVIRFDY